MQLAENAGTDSSCNLPRMPEQIEVATCCRECWKHVLVLSFDKKPVIIVYGVRIQYLYSSIRLCLVSRLANASSFYHLYHIFTSPFSSFIKLFVCFHIIEDPLFTCTNMNTPSKNNDHFEAASALLKLNDLPTFVRALNATPAFAVAALPIPEHHSQSTSPVPTPEEPSASPMLFPMPSNGRSSRALFAENLFAILEAPEYSEIITWLPDGNVFVVINRVRFASEVLPKAFNPPMSHIDSFYRRLLRWNFHLVTKGPYRGACYHKFFRKGQKELCKFVSLNIDQNRLVSSTAKASENDERSRLKVVPERIQVTCTKTPVHQGHQCQIEYSQTCIKHQGSIIYGTSPQQVDDKQRIINEAMMVLRWKHPTGIAEKKALIENSQKIGLIRAFYLQHVRALAYQHRGHRITKKILTVSRGYAI